MVLDNRRASIAMAQDDGFMIEPQSENDRQRSELEAFRHKISNMKPRRKHEL